MFDIGWSELLIVGAVALVVIGPRDLPRTLRALGQMTAKLRRMAGEFQGQFNEAMREAELDEIRRGVESVKDATSTFDKPFNPIETARNEIKGAIEGAGTVAKEDAAGTTAAPAPVNVPPPDLPPTPDPAATITPPQPQPPAPKRARSAKSAGSAAPEGAKPAAKPRTRGAGAAEAVGRPAEPEGAVSAAASEPAATKPKAAGRKKKSAASPADGGEA